MATGPEEPFLDVRVPDDPRDLEHDRLAYLHELRRRAADAAPAPDPDPAASWDPPAADRARRWVTRFLLGWLVFVVVTTGLMLAFTPRSQPPAATLALAPPTGTPGTSGALLPDAVVDISGDPRPLRSVRPAVIAVVPPGACPDGSCDGTVRDIRRQAREYQLRLYVAGAPDSLTTLQSLTRGPAGGAPVMTDPAGALDTYAPAGLTLVLVHADGVVGRIIRDVEPGARLEQYLRPLKDAGAGRL